MKKVLFMLLTMMLTLVNVAAQQPLDQLINRDIESLVATYKMLHANPELSFYEEKTAAFIAKELRAMGYTVTERLGQYTNPKLTSYGLVGIMKNGNGPTVLLRTDLDALPLEEKTGLPYASRVKSKNDEGQEVNIMHACGHDLHMSCFLGTAKVLAAMKEQWKGTLILVGQPAEERGAGAKAMLKDEIYAKLARPDYALALHSDANLAIGKVSYSEGYTYANVDSVDIIVRGMGGHGSTPDKTKDPIVVASQIVVALQTIVSRERSPLDPAVVTVGAFQGGTKRNIIPDEVRLELTIRTYKDAVRRNILSAIERIAKGIALAAGIPNERAPMVRVIESESIPSVYNNPELTRRLACVWENTLGKDNVIAREPSMGGEDFGLFSLEGNKIPLCIFSLGTIAPERVEKSLREGEPLPSLHSSLYAPIPEPAIKTGIKALTTAVLDLMAK